MTIKTLSQNRGAIPAVGFGVSALGKTETRLTINNLALSFIVKSAFPFVPSARRSFAAHPDKALALLL